MKIPAFFFILVIAALSGCFPQGASTATGGQYDKSKDQTDYFVTPYGAVVIPGQWTKTHYNAVSGQQFFKGPDSVEIAIAFNAYNRYEFNSKGKLTGYNFVKGFYKWDSDYFVDQYGLKRAVIEKDSMNNYMIYRLYGDLEKKKYDSYFLIGEKKGNVSNFSISITDKWTERKKVDFLKNLFFDK